MPTSHLYVRFRELHRLSLADYDSYSELYRDYLATGLRLTGLALGTISQVRHDNYTILAVQPDSAAGIPEASLPLRDTPCARVVELKQSLAIADAGKDPMFARPLMHLQQPVAACLAAPLWVEDEIYGTLTFSAPVPRDEGFAREDSELIELMARGLGAVIERGQLEQQRQQSVRRMQENIDLFESAFRFAAIGMALVSPEGKWLRVNDAVCEILGYSEAELLMVDFQTLTYPEDLEADLAHVQEMLEGRRDVYRMEKRYYHRDGQLVWALLSVSLVRSPGGEPLYFLSQLQDVTESKQAAEVLQRQQEQLTATNTRLQYLATVDELTEVYNRRAFFDKFNAELERSARAALFLSVLIIDVDHFKQYNDCFGHPEGDRALKRVAEELRRCGRVHDVCARYGGEEFAMLLPHTDQEGSYRVAERVRAAVEQMAGLLRPLTVSIGCATTAPLRGRRQPVTAEAMLSRADKALYEAKAGGRNRVEWTELLVLE